MSTAEDNIHPPSPPSSGACASSEGTSSPSAVAVPFFSSSGFSAPLAASPFTTSYTPFKTVSSVSAASSHASLKQQSRAEVVARTVHLRCLPPFMKQKDLADVFDQCGEYLRVRICGNAATHQKWVYGFVEFATTTAAAAMLTHSGMELSNGADKPALRLKCSASKQPILDCMAYDADVLAGTPCGFGRGYLAECTLNDALLVVGNSAGTGASAGGSANHGGGGGGGGRRAAANRALTALTVCSIRKVAATGCGCGCSGVNCCGCCHCWKGEAAQNEGDASQTSVKGDAAATPAGGCGGCCNGGGEAEADHTPTAPSDGLESNRAAREPMNVLSDKDSAVAATAAAIPEKTSASFEELAQWPATMNADEMEMMQQLAAAFEGLRATAAAAEGQLDGPAIVRRAETMTLDALTRASHLSSDTRIQDILCDLAQLLSFLDANAAVTGGAAQTASGDCTATLPQRVTQLRMLANLVGALLCLLRRSVADAVPYVEAVLVTFAQIPPSSLLLRARQHEKGVAAGKTSAASPGENGPTEVVSCFDEPRRDSRESAPVPHTGLSGFPLGAFIDEDVTGGLLDMMDEDEDNEGLPGSPNRASRGALGEDLNAALQGHGGSKESTSEEVQQLLLMNGARSTSCISDESTAFLNSADMADLCRRDEGFTRYCLNAVVSVGIAMESVQPMIARSAYMLANARAVEVLGEPSQMVAACLAAAPNASRLCETLFHDAGAKGRARDITFFPHRFFESVNAVRQQVRDLRGSECFWRQLPPNHVVPLYRF